MSDTQSDAEPVPASRIIFINGTSSSGKTTIARELQKRLPEPFCYYASDQLADQGFRPRKGFESPPAERERFFDGFHRSIVAFGEAGNDLIVEHIVEEQRWADDLVRLLSPFDVFWVGVHAPIEELDRREKTRGNRRPGEARFHLKTHNYLRYDVEVDSTQPAESVLERIISAWRARLNPARKPGGRIHETSSEPRASGDRSEAGTNQRRDLARGLGVSRRPDSSMEWMTC